MQTPCRANAMQEKQTEMWKLSNMHASFNFSLYFLYGHEVFSWGVESMILILWQNLKWQKKIFAIWIPCYINRKISNFKKTFHLQTHTVMSQVLTRVTNKKIRFLGVFKYETWFKTKHGSIKEIRFP